MSRRWRVCEAKLGGCKSVAVRLVEMQGKHTARLQVCGSCEQAIRDTGLVEVTAIVDVERRNMGLTQELLNGNLSGTRMCRYFQ